MTCESGLEWTVNVNWELGVTQRGREWECENEVERECKG
jgi:hypothetical protein